MRGAKRRHRSQNQAERRAKPARRSSRCIYPKTAAQKLHQSRSVLKNQNPQNGQHWTRFDWGSGAVCFGASPVAAVFGSAPGSATPPEHRIHCKPAPPAPPFKQDISTLLGVGHFYFALTGGTSFQTAFQTRFGRLGYRAGATQIPTPSNEVAPMTVTVKFVFTCPNRSTKPISPTQGARGDGGLGTTKLIWYSPTKPGVKPANSGVTGEKGAKVAGTGCALG